MEKERKVAASLAKLENERKNQSEKLFGSTSETGQNPAIVLQLKKALEEVHILNEEKRSLLERCNKLSHELRHARAHADKADSEKNSSNHNRNKTSQNKSKSKSSQMYIN